MAHQIWPQQLHPELELDGYGVLFAGSDGASVGVAKRSRKIPKQILQCSTHLSASVFLGRSERGGLELAGGEHHRLKVWRHDACKMESEKESEQAGKLHLGFMRDGTGWKVLVDGRKKGTQLRAV